MRRFPANSRDRERERERERERADRSMHAKSKISGILPKGFKAQKCKTSLKMSVSRIKLLKNKKEAGVKQLRRELAKLLEEGQEQTARIRVEHVIREEKTMSAYDLIEVYCELVAARLPIIESQKSCPIDLKEAISSVIFASPRCADIPELADIRKHFTAKYGKEFVTAALEVRPECGVSRLMVEKLSATAPDVELKMKVLKDIAAEHSINWEPKPFEDIQKHKGDLLSGPTSFTSVKTVKTEASNLNSSPAHKEDDPGGKLSEKFMSTETIYNSVHPESRILGKKSGNDEVRQVYPKENPSSWNTKYKDAASAAEAAAESAERASIAARAAAEFASREHFSRQHSADSRTTPAYVAKSGGSESLRNSKLEISSMREATNVEDHNKKSTNVTKGGMQNQEKVDRDEYDSRHSTPEIVTSEKFHPGDSLSRESTSEDEFQEDDLDLHDNADKGLSAAGAAAKDFQPKHEDDNHVPDNFNKKSNESAPTYDNYTIWDDHESAAVHSSEVAFDRSDSDADDNSFLGKYEKENLFDSALQQKEQPSYFSPDRYTSRTEQHTSESVFNQSSSEMHFRAEDQSSHSEQRIFKADLPSQVNDSLQPSYDSYGPSSESEDEIPSHSQRSYEKSSSSVISGHKSVFMNEKIEVEEDTWFSQPVLPRVKDTHLEVEPNSLEKSSKRPGVSVRNSQHIPVSGRSPRNLDSRGGLTEEVKSDSAISGESYDSTVLSLGNIIPGSRNRFGSPPYGGNPTIESYPRYGVTSSDDSHQKKKGTISDVAEIPTSGVAFKEKVTNESHSKDYHSNLISLVSYEVADFDKNKPSQNTFVDETSTFGSSSASSMLLEDTTHNDKIPKDDDPVQAYLQQRRKKQNKEVTYQSSPRNPKPDNFEEHSYGVARGHHGSSTSTLRKQDAGTSTSADHRRSGTSSSEVPVQETYVKKPHVESFDDSSSSMTVRYSTLDDNETEQSEPAYSAARRVDNNVKLSRRTRPGTSDIKEKSSVRNISSTNAENSREKEIRSSQRPSAFDSFTIETKQSRDLDDKVQPNHKDPYSSDDEPSIKILDVESSSGKGISKSSQQEKIDDGNSTASSSGKTTSREGSIKSAAHTHPKLPDYDSLAAHFQSLRANVRRK